MKVRKIPSLQSLLPDSRLGRNGNDRCLKGEVPFLEQRKVQESSASPLDWVIILLDLEYLLHAKTPFHRTSSTPYLVRNPVPPTPYLRFRAALRRAFHIHILVVRCFVHHQNLDTNKLRSVALGNIIIHHCS